MTAKVILLSLLISDDVKIIDEVVLKVDTDLEPTGGTGPVGDTLFVDLSTLRLMECDILAAAVIVASARLDTGGVLSTITEGSMVVVVCLT